MEWTLQDDVRRARVNTVFRQSPLSLPPGGYLQPSLP